MGVPRRLIALLKWAVALGLTAALLLVVYRVHALTQAERDSEAEGEKVQTSRHTQDGIVTLDEDSVGRYQLATAPAVGVDWRQSVLVYGQVVPNPQATVEIHAPAASILRAADDADWPVSGRWVRKGQLLGWIDIRVGPQERLTLRDNLNSARLRKAGAAEVVRLRQERVKRLTKVTHSEILPRQQLDDALVLLSEAQTLLAIADAGVALWEQAEAEIDRPNGNKTFYSLPLIAPADGEITELAARPGAAIEAGGLVARLVDFRRPLVRLDIPPALLDAGAPRKVELFGISTSPSALSGVLSAEVDGPFVPVVATLVGPAPQLDVTSQFVGYWYAVDSASFATSPALPSDRRVGPDSDGPASAVWRPGLRVTCSIAPASARRQPAIAVPQTAVLYHLGRPLVYVAVDPIRFQRREVRLLGRLDDRWILAASDADPLGGVAAGELVVCREAQVLLSEEFRGDEGED